MPANLKVILDNITTVKADAVVNAANAGLFGGGGVDGAIHQACGPELLAECRKLRGCPSGQAKTTRAFGSMAANGVKYIIHAVGPIWRGGAQNEADLLKSAYTSSLQAAMEVQARTVTFPAISCGVYSYPIDQATQIAVAAVKEFIEQNSDTFDEITFVAFSEPIYREYKKYL